MSCLSAKRARSAGQTTTEYLLIVAVSVSLALILSRSFITPYLNKAWDTLGKGVEASFGRNLNRKFFWSK